MGRTISLDLTEVQVAELKKGYRHGKSNSFRERCYMVLLKFEGLPTREIAKLVSVKSENQINKWIKIYKETHITQGLKGLYNKPGQGRKLIYSVATDAVSVEEIIKNERQRLKQAKLMIEEKTGKISSLKTLKRFLKNLTAPISGFVEE
jgi:transposase-like protein